jgi:membrane fusion protein, multidrug efflux system
MMTEPAAPEVAPPGTQQRGSRALRIAVAAAVIGAAVWYLRSSQQEQTRMAGNAAIATGSGGDRGGQRGGAGGPEGRVVPVRVVAAERTDLPIWLEGLGSVAASQQVTVRPQVDGRIDKVVFVEGQAVKRGDLLVQIDPRPFLVALHQAQGALARDQAQLDTLVANLKRYQGLQTQDLVAGQQVEQIAGQVGQLEGSVRIDRAQIESAQLQLDYAQVKAPIDGITGVRQVDAGNIVHPGDPNGLVVITAIDPAAVVFTVPQDQLAAVAQAMARGDVPVEIRSRDGASKLADGKLTVIDNQINQATATLRLKALVPNPGRLLWPNAFVKARLLVETRRGALVVPAVAIQRGPQGSYVYAVGSDKTAQMKPVTIALTAGELVVIGGGLDAGDQVIVEGQSQVRPGGRVEPVVPGGAGAGEPRERGERGSADAPPQAGRGERPADGPPARSAESPPRAGSGDRPVGGPPRRSGADTHRARGSAAPAQVPAAP